jgi:hypothetical protein
MNQSEQINELATALAKCQGEITPAIKDSSNPYFKSKYADLNSVWSVCRQPLSKHGLAVIQTIDKDESGNLILITTLVHNSGQWIRSKTPIPLMKSDPQAMGSSITYMRRYSLSAIVGISTDEDDDGEKAMNRNADREKPVKEKKVASGLLNPSQTQELIALSENCDPDYLAKIYTRLEQKGIKGFENITQDLYELIVGGMKKNAEIYKGNKDV